MQPLFLNPFGRSRPDVDILNDDSGIEEAKVVGGGVDDHRTEGENFALMLQGNGGARQETGTNLRGSPLEQSSQRETA